MIGVVARNSQQLFQYKHTTKLGRWNRFDNVDIKAAYANIDCCGDSLCGDVIMTKAAINKLRRRQKKTNSVAKKKWDRAIYFL